MCWFSSFQKQEVAGLHLPAFCLLMPPPLLNESIQVTSSHKQYKTNKYIIKRVPIKATLRWAYNRPVGNLFINSCANEGPDSAINGWREFLSDWGIIWDIVLNVLSSRPLLREMKGRVGATYSAMPSRKEELNCKIVWIKTIATFSIWSYKEEGMFLIITDPHVYGGRFRNGEVKKHKLVMRILCSIPLYIYFYFFGLTKSD